MQLKRYLLSTLLWVYIFAVPLAAQEKIVKITDLKESSTTLSNANEAIVLVKSAIEDIEVKTNMDNPVDKPSTTSNGIFTYKLVIRIGEDELDGAETVSRQIQANMGTPI